MIRIGFGLTIFLLHLYSLLHKSELATNYLEIYMKVFISLNYKLIYDTNWIWTII